MAGDVVESKRDTGLQVSGCAFTRTCLLTPNALHDGAKAGRVAGRRAVRAPRAETRTRQTDDRTRRSDQFITLSLRHRGF
jgi:hypothetical protein